MNTQVFFKSRLKYLMGEAKRRKQTTGENYGQADRIVPWLPLTAKQAQDFVTWSTRGAWFGIGGLALLWLTVRIIGPTAGWWTAQ
jgi:Protein of unknown function (DUF2839)